MKRKVYDSEEWKEYELEQRRREYEDREVDIHQDDRQLKKECEDEQQNSGGLE